MQVGGVTAGDFRQFPVGLLSMNVAFGFMGLLGALSLTGLLIKNAIVLIEEIDIQSASGKEACKAILDSASRSKQTSRLYRSQR